MENLPDIQTKKLIAKLNAAGLTRKLLKSINADPALVKAMIDAAQALVEKSVAPIDLSENFEKIAEFKIIVPDYSLDDYIKIFRDKFTEFTCDGLLDLDNKNFCPSDPLKPGETKVVTLYRLTKTTKWEYCLSFASEHGQLPNAHGIATIWHNNSEALHPNLYLIGLDKKENLQKDWRNSHQVSIIGKTSSRHIFDTVPVDTTFSSGFCVAVFN